VFRIVIYKEPEPIKSGESSAEGPSMVICGGGEEHPVPAPKTTANTAADSMINNERCRVMSSSYI
jgi:hypothetical protein